MPRGVLKTSFKEKGFAFIATDPDVGLSSDVFLHINDLAPGEDATVFVRGAAVEFEVALVTREGAESPQARMCRRIAGGGAASPQFAVEATGLRGTVKFWSPLNYGFLVNDDSPHEEFYAPADSVPGGYLREGDAIEFDLAVSDSQRQAVNVRLIGWTETGDPFTDNVDMGHPRWAAQLAAIAEPEAWNYQEKPAKDRYTVLRSYVKYTFLRLYELPDHLLVSDDEERMSFNTGLVTPYQEQIFAVLKRRGANDSGPPWTFRAFERASSYGFLTLFGGDLPPLAWYFDDPSQLVYDTQLSLHVNVEHVPHDPERFSPALATMSPQDLAGLVNAKAPEAIDRVLRNYKTAIPQFYRDGKSGEGKMQLLLPVALLSRDKVELALAVDRLDSGVYLGRTVLSLDWAYNNARLLTRPDTDWLRP